MDLLEHEQDLRTLWNQFTLAAGVKLFYTNTTQKTRQTQQITEISKCLCLNKEINMSFYEKNTINPFTSGKHENVAREVLTQD